MCDEECIDIMRHLILKYTSEDGICGSLTNGDLDLVEDYAAKLFNTYNGKDLEIVMGATINLLNNYRTAISYKETCKEIKKVLPKAMSHKKDEKKEDALIKHSEAIINLIFGGVGTKQGVKLRKELLDVIEKPKDYLVSKPPSISLSCTTKKKIKEYLLSKLHGKSKEINEFCQKIK